MQFAKPPEGFTLKISDNAQVQYKKFIEGDIVLEENWRALCERLKHTGHRIGFKTELLETSNLYILSVDIFERENLQIIYTILGQTLRVEFLRLVKST